MAKELKYVDTNKTLKRIVNKLSMNTAITRMISGLFAGVVITHIVACFWFLSSKYDDFNP